MELVLRLPIAQTLLLSAGPHAGKTSLLTRWREDCAFPCQYLGLTPEDLDPAVFLYRFLRQWPNIKARYESLKAELPVPSWGGRLGMAIGEVHPDFCLLLDDLHLVEATPLIPELMALVQHFPAQGTLVIASRHQLPEISRAPCVIRGANDPQWNERPTVADLNPLPQPLIAKVAVLHIIGEAACSPDGWELVRRNIACQDQGVHRLRPCWQKAAELLLSCHAFEEIGDEVEEELKGFYKRYMRTTKDEEIPRILERIPFSIRSKRLVFRLMEGRNLELEEAKALYLQALESFEDPGTRLGIKTWLLEIANRLQDSKMIASLLAQIASEEHVATPSQQAFIYKQKAHVHVCAGERMEAIAYLDRILAIPAGSDRELHFRHLQALWTLTRLNIDLERFSAATPCADRMVALALRHGFQRDLVLAYCARFTCYFRDSSSPVPLSVLLDIPDEGLVAASGFSFFMYLLNFGRRLLDLKAYRLTLRCFQFLLEIHYPDRSVEDEQIARLHQMICYGRIGRFERAEALYAELSASTNERTAGFARREWARLLVEAGHLQAADELVQACLFNVPEGSERKRLQVFQGWIRQLQGDSSALDEIKRLLETPEGAVLWDSEAQLLETIGLRKLPPLFHLHVFGGVSFCRAGEAPVHWPRKKVLSLLVLLVLHPEGISTKVLLDRLYQDSGVADPGAAFHTLVFNLRQVLKTAGASELLESSRGFYRLKWEQVAFCDLHEFDALYQKAQSLETNGSQAVASIFYQLALSVAPGPLFEGLPDVFEEQQVYEERIRHAQTFLSAGFKSPWLV